MAHYHDGDVIKSHNLSLRDHFNTYEQHHTAFIETFDTKVKSLNETVHRSVKRFRQLEADHAEKFAQLNELSAAKSQPKSMPTFSTDRPAYFSITVEPLSADDLHVYKQQQSSQAERPMPAHTPPSSPSRAVNHSQSTISTPQKQPARLTPQGKKQRLTGISRPIVPTKLNYSSLSNSTHEQHAPQRGPGTPLRPQRLAGGHNPATATATVQRPPNGTSTPLRPLKPQKLNTLQAQQQQQLAQQKGKMLAAPSTPRHKPGPEQVRPRVGMSPASRPRDVQQKQPPEPIQLSQESFTNANDSIFASSPILKAADASFQSLPMPTSHDDDDDHNPSTNHMLINGGELGEDNQGLFGDDEDDDLFDQEDTNTHKDQHADADEHDDADDQIIKVMVSNQLPHPHEQPKYSFSNATEIPRTLSTMESQSSSTSHRPSNSSSASDSSSGSGVYIQIEPTNPQYIAKMDQPKKFSFNNASAHKKSKTIDDKNMNPLRSKQISYAKSIPSMLQSTLPPSTNIADNFVVEVHEVDSDAEAEDLFHENELPDWARDMRQVIESHKIQTIVDADLIFQTPKGLTCDLTKIFNDRQRHQRYVKRGSSVFPVQDQLQDDEITKTNAALNILTMSD